MDPSKDTSNSKEHQSHQNKHGGNEVQKLQGCSSVERRGGDDKTGGRRPRSSRESLENEEDRRVRQRVSSADVSPLGTLGETRKTIHAREVHDRKQPVLENLFKYDVFLNHRGPDLKKTFVSHLAAALRQAGRDPFLDAKSLVKGQHAMNSINEALRGVHVHVAVFSPRYAESKYCLNELCDMLESQKPLIPVFYNVEPENLRWIEAGPFAKAFQEHLNKGRNEDVGRWKAALSQAAAITGFKLVDCDNNAAKLVEEIVTAVLNTLPPPSPLPVARHPVGLNDPSSEVIGRLHKMGDNVGVVGIYGMGGIGKTTLAREVYNREQSSFGSRCFLKDVKDAKGVQVMDLQMKMVNDLLHMNVERVDWNFGRWVGHIQKQRVLVVLDDISKRQQFDELIPDLKKLAPGSRVLITSRDIDVLRSITRDISEGILYPVPELGFSNSRHLFLSCAFRRSHMDEVDASFHSSIVNITRACGGVPLALEVMGGFLADKKNVPNDEEYWTGAISALRKNGDISTSLQISYDGLVNADDKYMFLDVACFMLGHSKHIAMEVWKSSGDYGSAHWSLSRLIDKCLVKVDADGKLRIHDLLRDMGRNVVMQRASCRLEMLSHIWDPSNSIKILQKKKGSSKLVALSVLGVDHDIACKAEVYAKLENLRYLVMDGLNVDGDFSGWLEELRWLQWRHCPHKELPWSLELPNLAVLDLAESKSLTHVWSRNFELKFPFGELRILILSHCINLMELPQDLNKLLNLRHLELSFCIYLTILPESLGELGDLEFLDLSHCKNLTSLPNIVNLSKLKVIKLDFCDKLRILPTKLGSLRSLTHLYLSGCSTLEELPRTIGELKCLTNLDLKWCISLKEIPGTIRNLKSLTELYLSRCSSLVELRRTIGNLECLTHLDLSGCSYLKELPRTIGNLKSLTELYLSGCSSLVELPGTIGNLKCLTHLYLRRCSSLVELPGTIGNLSCLTHLYLTRCSSLVELPGTIGNLKCLTELYLSGCSSLVELPGTIGNLKCLIELYLSGCSSLVELPGTIGNLECLTHLDLSECSYLKEIPGTIGNLKCLTELYLSEWSYLKELPRTIGNLKSLAQLYLSECSSLVELPGTIGNLKCLTELYLNGCSSLVELPGTIGNLECLTHLDLSECSYLKEIPGTIGNLKCLTKLYLSEWSPLKELPRTIGNLKSLAQLYLSGCSSLVELPGTIGNLKCLTELHLSGCSSLVEVPGTIGNLKCLTHLNLSECSYLKELPGTIGNLECLTHLDLSECSYLKEIPGTIGNLKCLTELYLSGCSSLVELPRTIGNLECLTHLDLSECSYLKEIPGTIGNLKCLTHLYLSGCSSLVELPGTIGNLSCLTHLYLIRCSSLVEIPGTIGNLKYLTELYLSGCSSLVELPGTIGNLKYLTELYLSWCSSLVELPGTIGNLKCLTHLYLSWCSSLVELPGTIGNLKCLTHLYLIGCSSLVELPGTIGNLECLTHLDLSE